MLLEYKSMSTNDDSGQESFECEADGCEQTFDTRQGECTHRGLVHGDAKGRDDPEKLRELYVDEGLTVTELGERLGCGYSTARRKLERHNISRDQGRPRKGFAGMFTDSHGYEVWWDNINGEAQIVKVHRLLAVAEFGFDAVAGKHVHHGPVEIPWATWGGNIQLKTPSDHISDHRSVSEETLIEEIQTVAADLGRAPNSTEITEQSPHAHSVYTRKFGTWAAALDAAGLNTADVEEKNVSTEQLCNELQRLADEFDRIPTQEILNEYGKYSRSPYDNQFETWQHALAEAGLYDGLLKPITKEKLVGELQRLADELGHEPTGNEMNTDGRSNTSAYREHFGTWSNAKEVAFEDDSDQTTLTEGDK